MCAPISLPSSYSDTSVSREHMWGTSRRMATLDLLQELQRQCDCSSQCWKWSGKRIQCISDRPSFDNATRHSSARECFPQPIPGSKGRATRKYYGQIQHRSKHLLKLHAGEVWNNYYLESWKPLWTSMLGTTHSVAAIRMPALEESATTGGTGLPTLVLIASHVFAWKRVIHN